jgi:hypothetical protein
LSAATAEQFASGKQLCVYFQSDYRFEFHRSIIDGMSEILSESEHLRSLLDAEYAEHADERG